MVRGKLRNIRKQRRLEQQEDKQDRKRKSISDIKKRLNGEIGSKAEKRKSISDIKKRFNGEIGKQTSGVSTMFGGVDQHPVKVFKTRLKWQQKRN